MKYVVTDSKNPQTLMCGTPPTAVSSGTVFLKYRKECLSGSKEDAGWAEWSVPNLTDAHDPDLWYETNPSLGYILSERNIRSELGDDQVDDNIQRLGLWLRYNQKSAISKEEWLSCTADSPPQLSEPVKLYYGIKFAKNNGNVSLSVAVKTIDGKIFIESIDCRPIREGNQWIIDYLINSKAKKVVIDGAGNQQILADDMKNAGVKCKAILPKVADVIAANALFEQKLFDMQLLHMAQPALIQAASNSEHRAIGNSGGFGYVSILEGADVSLLESAALAVWLCANVKERKKQEITY